MASFRFEVDTSPMALSVDSAKGHLNGVTVAVSAMETAVIATERQASKTICENVDNGFFMMIKSQISQKTVAAYSEMESRQVALLQLAKALDGVKRQMEGDYGMITRRYSKLFLSLNKALETRIKELDHFTMQLAVIRKNMVFDKLKDDSSMLFSISSEALPLAQTALIGKLKQKTREAMLALSESVYENRSYSEKVDSILVKKENDFSGASDRLCLPVIFFAVDSLLNSGSYIENFFTAQSEVWQNTAPIVSEISRVYSKLEWVPLSVDEKTQIRREFLALCEKNLNDEKVSKEIIRLFDESVWEECKNELQ